MDNIFYGYCSETIYQSLKELFLGYQYSESYCVHTGFEIDSYTYSEWLEMHLLRVLAEHSMHSEITPDGSPTSVCKGWYQFVNFRMDMGVRPAYTKLKLIDTAKPFSRDNCRWVLDIANKHQLNFFDKLDSYLSIEV